jgi:hypothetical protein
MEKYNKKEKIGEGTYGEFFVPQEQKKKPIFFFFFFRATF